VRVAATGRVQYTDPAVKPHRSCTWAAPGRRPGRRGPVACDDRWMADGARERREAIRHLADLRRRLAAAEDALADALAAMKRAEAAFDAAGDRFGAAERALDVAREERAQARRDRYAARQAYERAALAADRLQRRVTEMAGRLSRMPLAPGAGQLLAKMLHSHWASLDKPHRACLDPLTRGMWPCDS
jgi:hypothetical protein